MAAVDARQPDIIKSDADDDFLARAGLAARQGGC